jgi:putative transposase
MKANRGLSIERMVKLGRVSRSGFYRFQDAEPSPDRDMDLRDAIQRIAVEWPSYGRPRITAELRHRGWRVNPKRVYRLMREDNLLCVRRRKFVVTTDSNHGRKVYSNLARNMILTATDQLWRADITYIRLRDEFVFLAVILDAYSRRVIGWALDRTLEDELPLAALRMALSHRAVQPGLVHHSDRGSQYASNDYTDLLKAHQIDISMSRRANPWDKAYASYCTSFAHCVATRFAGTLLENLTPWAFRGGLSPGWRRKPMRLTPPLIVWMSFRLAIPWRVALPQSPPPLHQPYPSMR